MNNFVLTLVGLFIVAMTVVVAAFCGMYWSRHKILHLGPFLYGLAVHTVGVNVGYFGPGWLEPLLFGATVYGLAWIAVWQARESGRRSDRGCRERD